MQRCAHVGSGATQALTPLTQKQSSRLKALAQLGAYPHHIYAHYDITRSACGVLSVMQRVLATRALSLMRLLFTRTVAPRILRKARATRVRLKRAILTKAAGSVLRKRTFTTPHTLSR